MAQSYYLQGKYQDTVKFLNEYVSEQEKKGQSPKEQTLQLISDSYLKLNNNEGSTSTLEKLVSYYLKPNYWNNLLYTLMRSEGNSDRITLNIYRLMLDTNTLKQGSTSPRWRSSPSSRARRAKRSACWRRAWLKTPSRSSATRTATVVCSTPRRRPAPPTRPASPSSRPRPSRPRAAKPMCVWARPYLSFDQFDKAAEAIQRGIGKGQLKSTEEAQILLGIAQLKAKKADEATKAFKSVKGGDAKLTRLANLWALHAKA